MPSRFWTATLANGAGAFVEVFQALLQNRRNIFDARKNLSAARFVIRRRHRERFCQRGQRLLDVKIWVAFPPRIEYRAPSEHATMPTRSICNRPAVKSAILQDLNSSSAFQIRPNLSVAGRCWPATNRAYRRVAPCDSHRHRVNGAYFARHAQKSSASFSSESATAMFALQATTDTSRATRIFTLHPPMCAEARLPPDSLPGRYIENP